LLIVDDDPGQRSLLDSFLRSQGFDTLPVDSGERALDALRSGPVDMMISDVRMPGISGLDTLRRARQEHAVLPVLLVTAYADIREAVEAMRDGAVNYLSKPIDLDELLLSVQRATGISRLDPLKFDQNKQLPPWVIARSTLMQAVFRDTSLIAPSETRGLVTGESGVGKEVLADVIHAWSKRAEGPLVKVNCAAIPEHLLESELFGHEKGAFTGAEGRRIGRCEAAAEGTLFLDEIGDLPYHLQSKLLRVLQERTFERVGSVQPLPLQARVIAATNRDLDALCRRGEFREDLYYRLKLVNLHIPPLRNRGEDIETLAAHLLEQANRELGKRIDGIEAEALARLRRHPWPGNVRELEHALKRAALLARGSLLSIHDLDLELPAGPAATEPDDGLGQLQQAARRALHRALEQDAGAEDSLFHLLVTLTEQAIIDEALKLSNGNQVAASELLNLHRTTLRNKLRQSGPG
jgi:DNA-binding NtrC family response regulator